LGSSGSILVHIASVSFQLPARAVAFIGINKAVKSSIAQFFALFHGLLYLCPSAQAQAV
jgi:hypothetical protein